MDPVIIAIIVGSGTTIVTGTAIFLTLVWKIGRWQAKAEERGHQLSKKLDSVIERHDASITEAHARIDRHLEAHV